jgi:hypothetical protein
LFGFFRGLGAPVLILVVGYRQGWVGWAGSVCTDWVAGFHRRCLDSMTGQESRPAECCTSTPRLNVPAWVAAGSVGTGYMVLLTAVVAVAGRGGFLERMRACRLLNHSAFPVIPLQKLSVLHLSLASTCRRHGCNRLLKHRKYLHSAKAAVAGPWEAFRWRLGH